MLFQTVVRRPLALLAASHRATLLDPSPLREVWNAIQAQPSFEDRRFDLAILGGGDGGGDVSGPLRRGCVARAGSGGVQAGEVLVTVPWAAVLAERAGDRLADQKLAGRLLAAVRGEDALPAPAADGAAVWRLYEKKLLPLSCEMDGAALWAPNEVRALQLPRAAESQLLAVGARLRKQRAALARESKNVGERDEVLSWCQRVVRSRSLEVENDDDDGSEDENDGDDGMANGKVGRGEYDAYSGTGGAWRVLCPVVDLFNHAPESPATQARLDARGGLVSPWTLVRAASGRAIESLQLTAPYGAAEGEELLLPYGVETNLELLAAYGFTLPGAANEADYVDLFEDFGDLAGAAADFLAEEERAVNPGEAGSPGGNSGLAARRAVLDALDASAAPLAVRPGAADASAHLLGCAAFLLATEREAARFEEAFVPAAGHFTLQPFADDDWAAALEARARLLVAHRCRQRLASAPTNVDEDEVALAEAQRDAATQFGAAGSIGSPGADAGADTASRRDLLALEYRLGVKRLLGAWAEVPRATA